MNLSELRKKFVTEGQSKGTKRKVKKNTDRFIELFAPSLDLLDKAFDNKRRSKLRNLAASNFLVNCVTSIEIHLKSIILDNTYKDKFLFSELLKEKVSLNEAFEMFNNEKVTREYIIAHTSSFQNLESINRVFSSILKVDFLYEMENFKTRNEDSSLIESKPDWRKHIITLYKLRNAFVHEGKLVDLKHTNVLVLGGLCFNFIVNTDYYIDYKITQLL